MGLRIPAVDNAKALVHFFFFSLYAGWPSDGDELSMSAFLRLSMLVLADGRGYFNSDRKGIITHCILLNIALGVLPLTKLVETW